MISTKISYKDTKAFSNLIHDYINEKDTLTDFYNRFPKIENFKYQIEEKKDHAVNRELLVRVLKRQNKFLKLSSSTIQNIDALLSEDTYTITTGHQLCLFTGPLYFIYKIISVINLSQTLSSSYSQNTFVPVFWMASEDHDFDEVNHVNIFGKKMLWEAKKGGPVGRIDLTLIEKILFDLEELLGDSYNAKSLMKIFQEAYKKNNNLSEATRSIINTLFYNQGIVVLDGDDRELKQILIPIIKKDLSTQYFRKYLYKCSQDLGVHYKVQALVSETNFFYLSNDKRVKISENINVPNIEDFPEKFSPNVFLRPLYQELTLPNLAYIGGSSEIAYWMQLKTMFAKENVPFPILVLRNSLMLIDKDQSARIKEFSFKVQDLFSSEHDLHKKYLQFHDLQSIELSKQYNNLENVFTSIYNKVVNTDIKSAVEIEKLKQLKALNKLSKKIARLQKQQYKNEIEQISKLKNSLFPNHNLQERHDSFIPFYLQYGENFIEILLEEIDPLDSNFVILELE
ncbi:MAG: bacillithiol biosynthesis cysteine-adding enzyme BshC [Bacteroidota bacterium]|nr:bacillithiol biosynthesis cysteine-adding enzyme BshC [Bacteroidota bacterium]